VCVPSPGAFLILNIMIGKEISDDRLWALLQVEDLLKEIFKSSAPSLPDDWWSDLAWHIDAIYYNEKKENEN
jgi:hypothetical protein